MLPEVLLVERACLVQKGKKSDWVNLQKVSKSDKITIIDATLSANGTLSGKQTTRNEVGNYKSSPVETEFTKKGQVTDGQISICPFPEPMIENPFTAETRKMPVDFPRIGTQRVVVNITLPDGYTVDGKPRNATVSTPDKGIEGRILTTLSKGRIQMSCQFSINRITHSEKNYADLRQIFDLLAKYTSEQLMVKR